MIEFATFYEPRADLETRAILRRLALDPRMPAIWRQLQRRRRDGGGREYVYQVRRENIRSYEPAVERERDLALALLFGAAILSVRCSVVTKARLEEEVELYLAMAARLRQDLQLLDELKIAVGEELSPFNSLIAKCEDRARRVSNGTAGRFAIDRDRGDGKLRAYLTNFVAEMLSLFGTTSRHLLARIASVALDREVTPAMVRQAHRGLLGRPKGERLTTNC